MKAHQAEFSVSAMARVLAVSRSGFYAWRSRAPSRRARRDTELSTHIKAAHLESRGIYGAPRIHRVLAARGIHVGRKRVARLMRQVGLRGVTRRRFVTTTKRDDRNRPAPDLVDRAFSMADAPNQLWVADITHIPTRRGTLYLAVVLDTFSRKVVGWAARNNMRAGLIVDAVHIAIRRRGYPRGVIHHSDQGAQYTSKAFERFCKRHHIRLSMGSVGDCFDNAMAESFFATLETELLGAVRLFETPESAQQEVFEYIEGFYNTRRLHSALDYVSPTTYENRFSPASKSTVAR